MENRQDHWARWVLERQFGNDPEKRKAGLVGIEAASAFRDRVLENAAIAEGDVVLDVGCGSGLIGFGALAAMGKRGRVIFSDISQHLLDHCHQVAHEAGLLDHCAFVRAPAEDLAAIEDASVDVVTTRSVLIFVKAKDRAFREFWRVLRPNGRLSIFEPINRFAFPEPEHIFYGRDVTPILEIAGKLKVLYKALQPPGSDPMLDFDERDLFRFAEEAGFGEVHLELRAEVTPSEPRAWEDVLHIPGNPRIPSVDEAMRQTLTPDEAEQFTRYMRPLFEEGRGISRMAHAYLWAIKHGPSSEEVTLPS